MLPFPPKIKEAINKSARLKVLHATMSSGCIGAQALPARRAAHFQQIQSDAMPNPSDKLPPLHELILGLIPHIGISAARVVCSGHIALIAVS